MQMEVGKLSAPVVYAMKTP